MSYEFTEKENTIFMNLSNYMTMASILFLINGFMAGIHFFRNGQVFFLLFAISMIILSITFYIPTDNFKRIVTTTGRDIGELLEGFTEINSGWSILILILIVHTLNALINILTGFS